MTKRRVPLWMSLLIAVILWTVPASAAEWSSAGHSGEGPLGTLKAFDEAKWFLIEYTVDQAGSVIDLQERFGFPPGRGGMTKSGGSLPSLGPGRYEAFSFSPPEGANPTRGRKLGLLGNGILPNEAARGVSGEIAFRLETNAAGETSLKDVLFSSNQNLNRWLPELTSLIVVESTGEAEGTLIDVIFLKLKEGQVHTMSQNHYAF